MLGGYLARSGAGEIPARPSVALELRLQRPVQARRDDRQTSKQVRVSVQVTPVCFRGGRDLGERRGLTAMMHTNVSAFFFSPGVCAPPDIPWSLEARCFGQRRRLFH